MSTQERGITPEQAREKIDEKIMARCTAVGLELARILSSGEDGTRSLEYHTVEHTETVMHRHKRIIDVMRRAGMAIGEREEQMGQMEASLHDAIRLKDEQEIEEKAGRFQGMKKRVFAPTGGENESMSVDIAHQLMDKINEEFPRTFSDDDKLEIRQGISVTKPGWDPDLRTVTQPNLTPESRPSHVGLAWADLGAAGMGGAEEYQKEGDAVFREENLDIGDAVALFGSGEDIDEDHREYFRSRMLDWSEGQIYFAKGQQVLNAEQRGWFDEKVQRLLANEIFTKFDESIQSAMERFNRRKSMLFMELARDMGYAIG